MNILTLNNQSFNLNEIPEQVDDLRFCILDNTNYKDPDFFFIPLIFLESFNAPALVLEIGSQRITMPVDWQILIGEPDQGDLEVVPLTAVNDRGFNAFVFNPLSSFRPEFHKIEVVDIYQDMKWFVPKLKPSQMLSVPLDGSNKPNCVYFVRDVSKQSEVVNYSKIW